MFTRTPLKVCSLLSLLCSLLKNMINLLSLSPEIRLHPEKQLVGISLTMRFDADRTPELWRTFMPRRKEITNIISTDLYCMQIYAPNVSFTPQTSFDKWAAVEVASYDSIPANMQGYTLLEGEYAVFIYKGRASDFADSFRYIFMDWLPNSNYQLDNRPHFELLGAKYKNDSPDSEEEIWIPIINK